LSNVAVAAAHAGAAVVAAAARAVLAVVHAVAHAGAEAALAMARGCDVLQAVLRLTQLARGDHAAHRAGIALAADSHALAHGHAVGRD
jgi:hypothetical protein